VGWNWVREIATSNEVWVITRSNNRERIENALAKESLPNVHWVYVDLPRWTRFWKKGSRGLRSYYLLWQFGAYLVARKLHRTMRLDLVHHLTFGTYWMPSFLSFLPVPFMWGPLGGGESEPRGFWTSLSLRGKFYELLRDLARTLSHLNPIVRLSAQRALVALSKTEDTKTQLRVLGARHVRVYSEVGLDADEIQRLNNMPFRRDGPFRLISLGRLIHWKGFHLGLGAFAQFHRQFPASEYWLIGDGPERRRLERLAQKLGVSGSVRFWGNILREQGLEKLVECDVLVHPSLHDSGGWVCVEAMAAGRPVICLDLGGPAAQVTEETGIKVPAMSPEQVVRDLAAAMNHLAVDTVHRKRLGEAGRKHAREYFGWDGKTDFICAIYNSVASSRPANRV
jgi:glycosyltransferase involved in cell wall biosynthesis